MFTHPRQPSDATKFLIKKELRINEADPYNCDPTLFHGWARKILSKIEGVDLSPGDIIEVLEKNTSNEAKEIVRNYQFTSLGNPASILQAIWAELYDTSGNPDRIYQELDKKLSKFGEALYLGGPFFCFGGKST